ncbi:lytic transglycosylase domain-containing protein [Anaerophaga thermohalophila]|uniref:lytic transglycosylase domain-containing protein n=1 Tax=Anaerophaga thermohalophila TaxID=177400 RepID=UPI000237C49E|nr:lytic transglycosylase domain-containing protein [Anaerophaga thermohalophila]
MTGLRVFRVFVLLICIAQPKLTEKISGSNRVPVYLVESRIEKLDLQTPIPLHYNQFVQAYIDVYTIKRPEHLSGILTRSQFYFPIFEEYLDKYELPLELKYLAVIESALEPQAKSTSGAYGLWQFLYQASRMFDLRITSYIDERADPVKSTDAACRYLKYLYDNFNDWLLAIAAYNGGIGAVKDAIEKSGGETDYWKLRPYLPEQVRGYVPAFMAINYAMQYHHAYNIYPAPTQYRYDELLTTSVPGGISFDQISRLTGISVELLRLLNPVYKMDYIPVQKEPVRIVIPEDKIEVFHQQRPFFQTEEHPAVENPQAYGDTTGRQKSTHIVNPGEFFHAIAMQYECRIEDIMIWNNLEEKHLYAGQELIVWEPVEKKKDPGIHRAGSGFESQWFKADIQGKISEDEVSR